MAEIAPLEMGDLQIAHALLEERFRDDPEPMPSWREGDQRLLETCQRCTEVSAFGRLKYPTLVEKTAKLFYSGIKLHAFPNGNKRFGVVLTLVFLIKNGHRVQAAPGELSYMATWVAKTKPHLDAGKPDLITDRLIRFFETRIEPYD